MKKNKAIKEVSTPIGLLLVVLAAVLFFGVAVVYQNFETQKILHLFMDTCSS